MRIDMNVLETSGVTVAVENRRISQYVAIDARQRICRMIGVKSLKFVFCLVAAVCQLV